MSDANERGSTPGDPLGRLGWRLVAPAALTSNAFELFEETRTEIGGPPPHVHRERDEGFFVLEGRYVFVRGQEEIELRPGEFVFVPRGTRHRFRTLDAPARTLIIVAPAGLEDFFREMGIRIAAGESALEAMTGLSATHDSHPVD